MIKIDKTYKILSLSILLYILIFSLLSVWKYLNFAYNSMDLAIINQVFYNSSLGNFFVSSIHPTTYLSDHFNPILFLLLPFYYLAKSPITLLVIQTIFLGLCSWPIYLIAKNIISQKWALLISLGWLINPLTQNINLFEFHFIPLAIFGLLWTFYFYQQDKFKPFILFSLLSLLVREDVALVIFMFGLLAIVDKRSLKWILSPIILSVTYFIVAIKVISLFANNSSYKFFVYYSYLGSSITEIIKNIFINPLALLTKLFSFGNLELFLGLVFAFGFLPLFKVRYLILSLLVFVQLALSPGGPTTVIYGHYSSLAILGLAVATIYGLERILKKQQPTKFTLFLKKEKFLSSTILAIAIIYSSLTLGPLLGSLDILIQKGVVWPETRAKQELTASIPLQASIAATYEVLSNLSSRSSISSFNYVFLGKQQFLASDYILPEEIEFIIIDYRDLLTYDLQYKKNDFYQDQYTSQIDLLEDKLNDFGLVKISGPLALYQRNQLNTVILVKELSDEVPVITINDSTYIAGLKTLNKQLELFWNKINPNYYLEIKLLKDNQIIYHDLLPSTYGQNVSGPTISNIFLDHNKKILPGNYDLQLQVIDVKQGGIEIDSIRSTKNVIDQANVLDTIEVKDITL